jgi:molecular chaperone HtpG
MEYSFKINLLGIINLLSHNLYSGPQVYLRELLQNSVDAIRARNRYEPALEGEVQMEVFGSQSGKPPALLCADNGIGLTEEEVHRFLATIGQTSKSSEHWERPEDFLGQFGIGLLSCFIVSKEIVVITRSSLKPDAQPIEWRGRSDGTYSVKTLQRSISPGTQVYLTSKDGCEEFFKPAYVRQQTARFGRLLPFPVIVTAGKRRVLINETVPWRLPELPPQERTQPMLDFGRRTFGTDFFDAIPLRSEVGKVDGVAFVLPISPSPGSRQTHWVYLKNMLVSEQVEGLLPDWAFFVKCVINTDALRPTASRESFYEDVALSNARDELGSVLRNYLIGLAGREPARLRQFLALHHVSLKALAVQDTEFCRLIMDWLPIETSAGETTFGEYRERNRVVRYVPTIDEFRQIAHVSAAQGFDVVNGGYVHDRELLAKVPEIFPGTQVEVVDPTKLIRSFEDLNPRERESVKKMVLAAREILRDCQCRVVVKKFLPRAVPSLYSLPSDAAFYREIERSQEIADPLWTSILDSLVSVRTDKPVAVLCFNYQNPLVRKIARIKDSTLLQRSIEMLYVQSLLLGHHPLRSGELRLLNRGLISLLEWGIATEKRQGGSNE